MKVFKFGGASVKNAEAVKNVAEILSRYESEKVVVVVSAMGKTTNALEEIVDAFWRNNLEIFTLKVDEIREFHLQVAKELFSEANKDALHLVHSTLENLKNHFSKVDRQSYDSEYSQIVSFGELLSSIIVGEYLKEMNNTTCWADARKLVRTNHNYREAEIDWKKTEELILSELNPIFDENSIVVTQGFIGHTSEGYTTTLGREGSDFSAAIFAFCLNAESVTIWKDVPGMLNADPKYFENTVKLDKISFREAIELSYYGASVIHPKTVKPLQNKEIPLFVKSFIHPDLEGTIIQSDADQDHLVPSFIVKKNQILLSFTPKDFSFIVEQNLSDIFNRLARANAKINLMQNSALSFSVLLDEDKIDLQNLLGLFENQYSVKFNQALELVTIRHYDQKTIDFVTKGKTILLEQKTRQTARLVLRPISE